jgi:hypothetical protein
MELLSNSQIQLDASEYRMLTVLCGYFTPSTNIMDIAQLRACVCPQIAEIPKDPLRLIVYDLLANLLHEAEALYGSRRRH